MLVPSGPVSAPNRIGALTVRARGCDRLSARLRMEHVLQRADWAPPGLPSSALLVVRRVRLETSAPPGVEPAPLARAVSRAVREAVASARRPWVHADASRAGAVLFLDEAELAACLVRDWVRGAVADRWWWHEVLAGLDVERWLQGHVLLRGFVSAPAIAMLAPRGDATPWLARLDDARADEASRAVARAFALPLDDAPRRGRPDGNGTRSGAPPGGSRALRVRAQSHRWERWATSFPEVFRAVLAPRSKRLLAIAVAAIRAPSWARSAEFGMALTALEESDAPMTPSRAAGALPPRAARRPRRWKPRESAAPVLEEAPPTGVAVTETPEVPIGPGNLGQMPAGSGARPRAQVRRLSDPRVGPVQQEAPRAEPGRETAESFEPAPVPPASPPPTWDSPPPNPLVVPALPEGLGASAVLTRFGGIFYLLNAALALGLYADFTAPRGPSLGLSPWDWLAWMGQRWFGGAFASDSIWDALAALAMRPRESEPASSFVAPREWSVDEKWLAPWGPAAILRVHATARRLLVRHAAGFHVFDVRRQRGQPPLWQASALCRRYEALRAARLVRTADGGASAPSPSARLRWLDALSEYLCARLAAALGVERERRRARSRVPEPGPHPDHRHRGRPALHARRTSAAHPHRGPRPRPGLDSGRGTVGVLPLLMSALLTAPAETADPFAAAAHTPAQHFRLALFGVIGRVMEACKEGDFAAAREAHPFLADYLDEIAPHFEVDESLEARWDEALTRWETRATRRLPILSLLRSGVSRLQLDLMLTAGLVEEDSRFGEVFEEARGRDRRPTFGLLLAWWRADHDGGDRIEEVQRGLMDLVHSGLLQVLNPDAPRPDWLLAVPAPLWDALAGEVPRLRWLTFVPRESLPSSSAYVAPARAQPQCEALPALVRTHPEHVVVVRGPHHNGRKTLVGGVARDLGKALMVAKEEVLEDEARWRLFGALCELLDAVPVVDCDLAPGEGKTLPALPFVTAPLFVVTTPRGAWSSAEARPVLTLDLPIPGEEERVRHWERVAAGHTAAELGALAATARLASGNIRRAAAAALGHAALGQRTSLTLTDLQHACRGLRSARLETLATRLDGQGGLHELAVDDVTRDELEALLARCRLRERLAAGSAGGAQGNVGVRALLAGASGTGKTWAARVLASSLGKDLYRLEQSATISKWLGDTEKALHQAFSEAEELDVVLLIDEGDSVMGTRTSITTSNDRHANFQTNALLQIVESYNGILLVTSNAADCIDKAFARRLDVVINFRAPDERRRYDILRLHLPAEDIDDDCLQEIACRCPLNGGQLRNIVSHARLLALRESAAVRTEHLYAALAREYRKTGASCPVRPAPRA